MPDDTFERDLRRRLRAEADGVSFSLGASELEREIALRRRERRARQSWVGAAVATAAVVLIAVAIGPGGFLGPSNGVGGPTGEPSGAPSSSPSSDASGGASASPRQPAESGTRITDLARVELADGIAMPVVADLPPDTDLFRVTISCSGDGGVVIHWEVPIEATCASTTGLTMHDFVPVDADRIDLLIEPDPELHGVASVQAIDRDAPHTLGLSSFATAFEETVRGCGLVVDGQDLDGQCPLVAPHLPEEPRVVVVSRDPLTGLLPGGWRFLQARAGWTLIENGAPVGPEDVQDVAVGGNEAGNLLTIGTPSPGVYLLRIDVTAERIDAAERQALSIPWSTFSLPYYAMVEVQGRG